MAFTDYKTLRETAKLIQSNLFKFAPVRTGNLRDRLRGYNTINRILGNTKPVKSATKKYSFDATFEVEVAPPGAKYGQWFNDPPEVRSQRRQKLKKTAELKGNWNFGQRAIDEAIDSQISQIEDEIAESVADDIVVDLEIEIDKL
jgi:hypothetical protein